MKTIVQKTEKDNIKKKSLKQWRRFFILLLNCKELSPVINYKEIIKKEITRKAGISDSFFVGKRTWW